jgi:hypothetical protein
VCVPWSEDWADASDWTASGFVLDTGHISAASGDDPALASRDLTGTTFVETIINTSVTSGSSVLIALTGTQSSLSVGVELGVGPIWTVYYSNPDGSGSQIVEPESSQVSVRFEWNDDDDWLITLIWGGGTIEVSSIDTGTLLVGSLDDISLTIDGVDPWVGAITTTCDQYTPSADFWELQDGGFFETQDGEFWEMQDA